MNLSEQLLKLYEGEKPTQKVFESVIRINEKKRLKTEDIIKVQSEGDQLYKKLIGFVDTLSMGGFEDIAPDITKAVFSLADAMNDFDNVLEKKVVVYVKDQVKKSGIKKGGKLDGKYPINKFGGVKSGSDKGTYYYSIETIVDGHWMNIQPVSSGSAWVLISKDDKSTTYGNGEDFTAYDYSGKNIFFDSKELMKLIRKRSRYLK